MQLNLQPQIETNTIRAIEQDANGHRIMIAETCYSKSVILTPTTIEMWNVSRVSDLQKHDFDRLAELTAEVVLLGSGLNLEFPAQSLTSALVNTNTGLEVMNTAAACRTYNILIADGRSVVAALIL